MQLNLTLIEMCFVVIYEYCGRNVVSVFTFT